MEECDFNNHVLGVLMEECDFNNHVLGVQNGVCYECHMEFVQINFVLANDSKGF